MKSIFVDNKKCLACKACETACAIQHHPSRSLMHAVGDRKTEINVRVLGVGHEASPILCRQCDPADCLNACPSGAFSRDPESGAILIDPALCTACAVCAMVCKFDAISFKVTHRSRSNRDVAYKCDLCNDRVKKGGKPACVLACHSGALVYAEYDSVRGYRAAGNRKTNLPGDADVPSHVGLFLEMRRKEFSRRKGGK